MLWNKIKLFFIINTILLKVFVSDATQIPASLLQCYRSNETEPWIGNSMHLLIELIRKIEDANPTSIDIRLLSVNILHRLRLDGIERAPGILESEFITPFRANGIMLPKFKLLLQLISDTPGPIAFEESLTVAELCTLHRLVSSSVEPYERGDEHRVCPITLMSHGGHQQQRTNATPWLNRNKVQDSNSPAQTAFSARISNCPLEMGTIKDSDYGSFSPGTIIASIAAGLQPQNVRVNEFVSIQYKRTPYENLESMTARDTEKSLNKLLRSLDSMDNTYSAGLAGDLAEVCVFQGPREGVNVTVGLAGTWNDTHLPRLRYLSENHGGKWEITDSEIIAGIDGLYLAQQISSWVNRIRRIRLSQVLDMYYSARGVPTLAIESVNRGRTLISRRQQQQQQQMDDSPSRIKKRADIDNQESTENIKVEKKFNAETNAKLRQIFDNAYAELDQTPSKYLERFSISDGINSGCDRKKVLALIDSDKLKDETYFFSQVLQFKTSSIAITDEILRMNCDATVDRFFEYAAILLDTLPTCSDILTDYRKPSVDLNLIIDGSRTQFENDQLISHISTISDVSRFGSTMSIINGFDGDFMVPRTSSVATIFDTLRNYEGIYPMGLSLSRSFGTILRAFEVQRFEEQAQGIVGGRSKVILVVVQGQRITTSDFDSAQRMLQGSFTQFPDLYFIFITNDVQTIEELIGGTQLLGSNPDTNTPHQNRLINNRRTEQYRIIHTNSLNPSDFSSELFMTLKGIPKRLMAPFCLAHGGVQPRHDDFFANHFYEDYATPNQEIRYRVHPFYFRFRDQVIFHFQGVSYGDFTVCMARDMDFKPLECKTVSGFESATFNVTRPCIDILECTGIYFSVLMDKSEVKCSENDCRYPDQVRFNIRHEFLRCEIDPRTNSSSNPLVFSGRYLLMLILPTYLPLLNLFNW